MTQPNEYLPERAWNDEEFGPISELASKEVEQWEAEQQSAALAGHQASLDGLFEGLPTGMPFPVAFMIVIVKELLGYIPIIGPIGIGLIDLITGAIDFLSGGNSEDVPILGGIGRFLDNSIINVGQLTEAEPSNLLPEPTFAAGTISDTTGRWSVDTGTTRTADGTGAAKVTANGIPTALRSGRTRDEKMKVSNGKLIETVYVSHEGYSGSGQTILLQVAPFIGDVLQPFYTIAGYAPITEDLAWPGYELTGSYSPTEGVTGAQFRVLITGGALAGDIWIDDCNAKRSTTLSKGAVDGLPDAIGEQIARWQLLVDELVGSSTGVPAVDATLEQLREAVKHFNPESIMGAGGPATMKETVFGIVDAFLAGFTDSPGATGGSFAQATNVAQQIGSQSAQGAYAWQLVNIINNTPVARGFLPTGRSNYDITSANTFLTVTQATALSASFGLLQAIQIGVVSWYGYGTVGMTAFYVNIRKVNLATGVRTLVFHSDNIIGDIQSGSVPGDADFMFCEVSPPIAGKATDYYYVELVPVGGTHYVRGMSFSDNIKDHPLAQVPGYGTRVDYTSNPDTPADTLTKAVSGPDVPWIEFAVDAAGAPDYHEPEKRTLDNDGDTIPIPSWCNRVDAIPLGKGGDGAGGATLGFVGRPGEPGKYAPVTWERGTHFGDGAIITFNVLSGGRAKLSVSGAETIAEAGADGSGTVLGLTPTGKGPGVLEYNGQKYQGGVDQRAYGGDGGDPGGAGNGGAGILFQSGGEGGDPIGFICFRQVEVPGEQTEGDTTPPTPPTSISFSNITQSSATVTISGGTD